MFNKIDRSHFYVALISAFIAAIFTSILSGVLPPVMQNPATFSKITCTELNVVDAERKRMVSVSSDEYGGVVRLVDKDGEIHAFEDGKIQSFR